MAEDKEKNLEKLARGRARGLRTIFMIGIVVMIILSVIAIFTNNEASPELSEIDATVQAGVDVALTEANALTATPDATEIQATVAVRVEATLTQVAVNEAPPPAPPTTGIGFVDSFVAFISGIWLFFGRGGFIAQACCCVVPILAVAIGVIND